MYLHLKDFYFSPHAVKEMMKPDGMISVEEVQNEVFKEERIEKYLDDKLDKSRWTG